MPQNNNGVQQIQQGMQNGTFQTFSGNLQSAMYNAAAQNPNAAGEAQRVAKKIGVGPSAVQGNMDEAKRRAAVADLQQRNIELNTPILAMQLENQNFANIAHDQVDHLSATEKLFNGAKSVINSLRMPGGGIPTSISDFSLTPAGQDIGGQYIAGHDQYELGMLGIKAKRGRATAQDWARINQLKKEISDMPQQTPFGGVGSFIGGMAPMVPRSAAVGLAGAGVGAGAALAGVVSSPGVVPAAVAGFGKGFTAELGAQTYEVNAGNTYLDLLDKGVDENRAQWAAGAVGAVNTALQMGVLRSVGKPLGNAISGPAQKALNMAIGEHVAEAMKNPATSDAIKSAIVGWMKNTAIGTGEMGAQTAVSQIGEDWAKQMNAAQTVHDLVTPEFGKKLGESLVNAAVTMGAVGSFGAVAGLHANLARVAEAQHNAEFFKNLSDGSVQSEVRKRNPDAYEGFIAAQADGSPVATIYADGNKVAQVLAQHQIMPEDVEKAVPGFSQKLLDAQSTGGDIEIPTSTFAAKLAGTDVGNALLEHIRTNPDGMSQAEAREFQSNFAEQMRSAQDRAQQKVASDVTFAQSSKAVENDIYGQLKGTKTMPDEVARTNAALLGSMISTKADESGMTPEDFYKKYKPSISADQPAGVIDKIKGVFKSSGSDETRGGFDPSTLAIKLGNASDQSTFAHESGHYYLHVMADLAKSPDAPERVKGDMDTLLKWFGVKDIDAWHSMSTEEQAKYHEQFAYNFEKYLAEGKAPSIEMEGVFDRFARWMKRVYSNIKDNLGSIYKQQHGVDLPAMTGEVRDVMDHMTASEKQMRQAEAVRSMDPLFKEKPADMDENMWRGYQDMAQEARDRADSEMSTASIRNMQWLSNAKSRVLKELQKRNDAARSEVRAEVAEEMKSDPTRQAIDWLKNGKMIDPKTGEEISAFEGNKMDADAVRAIISTDRLGEPIDASKLRGMTAEKGGMHPDQVAEMFGFDNGEQMIRNIADAKPIKEEIDARTDQRMLERYGDINDPEVMNREVERALHNEARARFVAVELRHLQKSTQPVRLMLKAAQESARNIIANTPLSEVSTTAHGAAEARAARAAEEALRKGDSDGAVKAKQDQLVQHELTREAANVQRESQKIIRYLGKYDNPSAAVAKAVGADYMDKIQEILGGYELSKNAPVGDNRAEISDWVRSEYDRTGVMPSVSDNIISTMGQMHWKDMSINQLRDLNDAVKSIDHVGRRAHTVEVEGKAQSIDEMIDRVKENLSGVKHTESVDIRQDLAHAKGLDKIGAQWLNAKNKIAGFDAALLKMEQLFQWIDSGGKAGLKEASIEGPMQQLFHMASNAEGKEREMRAGSVAAIRNLRSVLGDAKIDIHEKLDVPELPRRGRGNAWYREELISMALNMGNASNKEKMLEGYQWTEMQAISAINRLMSKPEMDFVQGVWDHIGSYADSINEVHRRTTGTSLKMIDPEPITTKHGVYRGGYYPVVYDSMLDRSAEMNQARNGDKLFESNYANPSTSKGHTVERSGYKGPIYFGLSTISRHLDQVTHDLAWREPIINMNKVLSDPRLLDEVDQTFGRAYSKQFRPWLQAMANDKVFNTSADSAWEHLIRKVRTNTTMVGIGFRLSTMQIHGLSALSNSVGEVGGKWFAKGAAQFAGIDRIMKTRDFIFERSPEMANRMNEMDRNIHEAIDEINRDDINPANAATSALNGARKMAFRGVAMLDMASAMPTWMAAYLKGMEHESKGGMGLSEADSIEYANRAVRNAHGGGGVKDLAEVQRDKGTLSLATMFYSFWNHMYNRQRDLAKGWGAVASGEGSVKDFPRLLARSWYYFVVPQMIHAVLKGGKSKNDDGSLYSFLEHTAEEVGLGFVSGVPILRDMASAAVTGRDYSVTPLEQAGKSIVTAAQDAIHVARGEGASKHTFQNTAQAAGYVLGLPTAQPASTVKFLWDVLEGDQNPQDVADWWRGITTGKME